MAAKGTGPHGPREVEAVLLGLRPVRARNERGTRATVDGSAFSARDLTSSSRRPFLTPKPPLGNPKPKRRVRTTTKRFLSTERAPSQIDKSGECNSGLRCPGPSTPSLRHPTPQRPDQAGRGTEDLRRPRLLVDGGLARLLEGRCAAWGSGLRGRASSLGDPHHELQPPFSLEGAYSDWPFSWACAVSPPHSWGPVRFRWPSLARRRLGWSWRFSAP